MSKRQILVLLGVWVGVFLFLGLSSGWLEVLAVITGVAIIALAYSLGSEPTRTNSEDTTYVEHKSAEQKSVGNKSEVVVSADPTSPVSTDPSIDNSNI